MHNLAAYFLSALKNDYQSPKGNQEKVAVKNRKIVEANHEIQKSQAIIRKIRRAYVSYREQMIDQAIQQLNARDYRHFMQDFRDYSLDAIQTILRLQRNKYTEETILQSPQVKALLRQFAITMLPDLEKQIMPIEKFVLDLPEESKAAWLACS